MAERTIMSDLTGVTVTETWLPFALEAGGENCRSLGCTRDDKVEGGDSYQGPLDRMDRRKQQVPALRFHGTLGQVAPVGMVNFV
jgi:hypothetical protein